MNIVTITLQKRIMMGSYKPRSSLWFSLAADLTHCGPARRHHISSKFA